MSEGFITNTLERIWREILGIDPIPYFSAFTDLGGTSITAELVAERIRRELTIDIGGREILHLRTLANLVDMVSSRVAHQRMSVQVDRPASSTADA